MKIINKSKYKILKKIKINKNIFFKNIKIVFEKIFYKKKNKLILLCHALTGSHHFSGIYKNNLKNIGWWNKIIDEYLLNLNLNFLCINNINSNFGTTNNFSYNPLINKKYNNNFPKIKLLDWTKVQYKFIKIKLKINKIFIIIGGSFGGMQLLLWSLIYPNFSKNYICIASTGKMSKNNLIKNKINKLLINYSKNIFNKNYYTYNVKSIKTLKLLRIISHLYYMSKYDIKNQFLIKNFYKNYKIFNKKINISEYFFFKSNNFYKNFNINSYLYIICIINKFNFKLINNKNIFLLNYFIISFKNDKRFFYKNSEILINFFIKKKNNINYKIIYNYKGHDSFLIKDIFYKNLIKLYINYISER
ncbi:Homoserine O-acetyltransferase [Candidatus Nasuia deltocephalinicola]|nr:Homoserine O-acetyltransferase [Candidatus Nasuia deltocephalinicola]